MTSPKLYRQKSTGILFEIVNDTYQGIIFFCQHERQHVVGCRGVRQWIMQFEEIKC